MLSFLSLIRSLPSTWSTIFHFFLSLSFYPLFSLCFDSHFVLVLFSCCSFLLAISSHFSFSLSTWVEINLQLLWWIDSSVGHVDWSITLCALNLMMNVATRRQLVQQPNTMRLWVREWELRWWSSEQPSLGSPSSLFPPLLLLLLLFRLVLFLLSSSSNFTSLLLPKHETKTFMPRLNFLLHHLSLLLLFAQLNCSLIHQENVEEEN